LTVDDGLLEPFLKLAPEMERRGWRGTFFVCTEMATNAKSWSYIKKAFQKGHEIGNHTHTHPNMTKISIQKVEEELKKSIGILQKELGWNVDIPSFAFPYEQSNPQVGKKTWDFHRYLRGGDQGVKVPPNPVPLNDARNPNFQFLQAKAPTRHYPVAQWNTWVDAAVKQKKWLIEEYHGVDGKDWEPRTMTEFKAHFDHIEKYGSKIWVAPVKSVGYYINERQTTSFTVKTWSSKEIVVVLKSRFGTKFKAPLSYVLQLPAQWGWKDIKVAQDGKKMRTQRLYPNIFRIESIPVDTLPVRITEEKP